jgi:hypothetical protein
MDKMSLNQVQMMCRFFRTMYGLDLSRWDIQDFEIFTLSLYTDSYVQLMAWLWENT